MMKKRERENAPSPPWSARENEPADMEEANARAQNEPALRHEGREDEPPRRLLKTMVRAPTEPTMQEEGREYEPPKKSQEKAKVGTQEPPNHCPTGCHGTRGPQVRMLWQSHGKPSQERQARRQGDGSERHVQLGFGWSPAALPDDPIQDFLEPGLEPPKPEVRVPMHGAMGAWWGPADDGRAAYITAYDQGTKCRDDQAGGQGAVRDHPRSCAFPEATVIG